MREFARIQQDLKGKSMRHGDATAETLGKHVCELHELLHWVEEKTADVIADFAERFGYDYGPGSASGGNQAEGSVEETTEVAEEAPEDAEEAAQDAEEAAEVAEEAAEDAEEDTEDLVAMEAFITSGEDVLASATADLGRIAHLTAEQAAEQAHYAQAGEAMDIGDPQEEIGDDVEAGEAMEIGDDEEAFVDEV